MAKFSDDEWGSLWLGDITLSRLFERPGCLWSDQEVEACIRWILKRKINESIHMVAHRLGAQAGQGDVEDTWLEFCADLPQIIRSFDPAKKKNGERGKFWGFYVLRLAFHCRSSRKRLPWLRGERPLVMPPDEGEDLPCEFQIEDLSLTANPHARFEEMENRKLLEQMLRLLPPKEQAAAVRFFLHQQTRVEIAKELGTTEPNVRVLLCRARKRIQEF